MSFVNITGYCYWGFICTITEKDQINKKSNIYFKTCDRALSSTLFDCVLLKQYLVFAPNPEN